eukprot:9750194-Prorocentrum_lima.AAC.1
MAYWHPKCPDEPQYDAPFIFTINKHEVSAVIKREFDNLSPVEIKTHQREVAEPNLQSCKDGKT